MIGAAAAGFAGAAVGAAVGGTASAGPPDAAGPAPTGTGPGAVRLDRLRLVSLSHVNDPATTNVFPGDPPFELEVIATIADDGYFLQYVREGEHTGTHWGAPGHFNEGAALADDLDPGDLFRPAVKIDARAKCVHNADYALTVADIKDWERKHGRIPDESVVIMWTGWESKWGTPAFPNLDAEGRRGAVADRHRPAGPHRRHRHRHVRPRSGHRRDIHRLNAGLPAPPHQPGNPGQPFRLADDRRLHPLWRAHQQGRRRLDGIDLRGYSTRSPVRGRMR
jgi:hypothetical protein